MNSDAVRQRDWEENDTDRTVEQALSDERLVVRWPFLEHLVLPETQSNLIQLPLFLSAQSLNEEDSFKGIAHFKKSHYSLSACIKSVCCYFSCIEHLL